MGSSGSGNFGTYSGGGSDRCHETIDAELEEVGRSEYFKVHSTVPKPGQSVRLRKGLVGKRLAVETVTKAEVIGLLSTDYSYLLACLGKGFSYEGQVDTSESKPVPSIGVRLAAVAP